MSKIYSVCLALATLILAGCGSKSSPAVPPPAIQVALSPTSPSVPVNGTTGFTATVTGTSNTAVTWFVDGVAGGNATAGTINSIGLYTAPAQAGGHKVTATSAADTTKSATAQVTVTPPAITVTINPDSVSLIAGGTQQFSAAVGPPTANPNVTWSVVSGGGTISSNWFYTAPSQAGTYTVTATSVADSTKTSSAQVTVTVPVVAVSISPNSTTITAGDSAPFTATVQGTTNTGVTWSVDSIPGGNSTVGTITGTGSTISYTSPAQPGHHTITATSVVNTNSSANASVTVAAPSLTVSPTSATVAPDGTQQFTASEAVTWSVDGIAGGGSSTGTITAGGLYRAPATIGAHRITATSTADSTVTATSYLTVINAADSAVLTYHNDDARDGAYLQELTLTPANVNSTHFGKILSYPVDGQIYAQPLYLPQVNIPGHGTRDVVFVVTQNNSVYAFDADASPAQPTTFWHFNFGPSVFKGQTEGVNPNVGILSTPVIDSTTNTIYLVDESSNGSGLFHLHALDVATGAEKFGGPATVTGTVSGTGLDSLGGKITLESSCYQRMGLALNPVTNAIYIPFGGCNHGWVLAYDKTNLTQKAIFNSTPNAGGGAFWGGGASPAIDDVTGDLYLMSGTDVGDENWINGSSQSGYNNAFLSLDPTNLAVESYFSPDDNFTLATNDADLGSGGNILVPGNSRYPKELIGGGKDGNVFVNDPVNMGGFSDSSNTVLQNVHMGTTQYNNIFSTPVYWNGFLYFHCEADVLRAYSWNASNPAGQQMSAASVSAGGTIYGNDTHGATPSLSANGTVNGIVWDIDNSAYVGTDPGSSGPSVLHAYDATNVAHELYNSAQNGARDSAGIALKFTVPTIANGRVFVPTGNELDIYGLLGH
jgi:hypothetical protein